MSCKIKSTLNFVKVWYKEDRREEVPFTFVSDDLHSANKTISEVVDSWVCVEKDNEQNTVYQCYLKNIENTSIFEASVFNKEGADVVLTDAEVIQAIASSRLKLIPTEKEWEVNGKRAVFVTHDLITPTGTYQGMSISDMVHKYLNDSYAVESL